MKTIIYAAAIITLLLSLSSCTLEDLVKNSNSETMYQENSDIDPPLPAPKPR